MPKMYQFSLIVFWMPALIGANLLLTVQRDIKEDFIVCIIDVQTISSWAFAQIDSIATFVLLDVFALLATTYARARTAPGRLPRDLPRGSEVRDRRRRVDDVGAQRVPAWTRHVALHGVALHPAYIHSGRISCMRRKSGLVSTKPSRHRAHTTSKERGCGGRRITRLC